MKIVVCGSRHFTDSKKFELEMDHLLFENGVEEMSEIRQFKPFTLISGGADGVDTLAREYAEKRGYDFKEYCADWKNLDVPNARIKTNKFGQKYNANAGFDRNKVMLDLADVVIAFWDGKSPGTKDMVTNCLKRNIPHMVVSI